MAEIKNDNISELKIINGTCFVIKNNKEIISINSNHQLQSDEIIVANSNTKIIFVKDGIEQVIEQPVPTCSTVSLNGIKTVDLNNSIHFNEQGIKNANFSADDISTIHNIILAGQDPTKLFEATAMGNEFAPRAGHEGNQSSSSAQSFVGIDYDNDALLAKAGFDTAYEPEIKKDHIDESSRIDHSELSADIHIVSIAGDDFINDAESHTKVPVTGTVGGDVKAGDTVTVSVDGKEIGQATVESHNGKLTWTAEVDGSVLSNANKDSVTATVTTTDEAGHSATATNNHTYQIDTDITAHIYIASVATDDNVNHNPDSEHTQSIIGTVSGDVKAGDIVTVTLDGQQLGTAEVQADKSWRLSVDGKTLLDAKADNVTATVTATDAAGNSQTATDQHDYSVNVTATIDIDPITGDNHITQQEGHQQNITITGTVGGQVQEGDIVKVTLGDHHYETKVEAGNKWSVNVTGSDVLHADEATATVTTSYSSHNKTVSSDENYQVEINAGVTIDHIGGDDAINSAESHTKVPVLPVQ